MAASWKHRVFNLLPPPLRRRIRRAWNIRTVVGYPPDEWEFHPILHELLEPGATVLDVGANIGYITKVLAEMVGPRGRVFACEPVPPTYDSLTATVRALRLENVLPRQVALSDHCGHVRMLVPSYQSGGTNFYESRIAPDHEGGAGGLEFEVPTNTLDTFVEQEGIVHVTFIKLDVEGHESAVLRGGITTLKEHRPALLVEVMDDPADPNGPALALFQSLQDLEYGVFLWERMELIPWEPGLRAVDYLFFHEEHLRKLRPLLEAGS